MITKTIDKWGNSQGIQIPKEVLKQIGIENPVGQTVQIEVKDGALKIRKLDGHSALQKQFENFDVDQYFKKRDSREIDWGKPAGKEIF